MPPRTSPGLPSEENPLEDYLRQQVSSWCGSHPLGVVYSRGKYFACGAGEFPKEPQTLEGVTLRIGIHEGEDFGYDCEGEKTSGGGVDSKPSYSQFILDLLQEILRFDVRFVSSSSWGSFEGSNRSWSGLAGLIEQNATDVTVCHWTTTERLAQVADYLVSTQETSESFVYLPQNLPLTQDVFVETFSRKLWVFFLLSIFLLVVSFRFSTSVHSMVRPDHEPWTWEEVTLWAVAAVSQQSFSRHPRGSSCRTTFLMGYVVTYLLYTGFAAGITSLLALQESQRRMSFEEVAAMRLRLVIHGDEYFPDFLEVRKRADSRALRLSLERSRVGSLREVFESVGEPLHVGFGSTWTLLDYLRKKVDPRNGEGFTVVPVAHSRRLKAFLVQKSFPFKRIFNYWLVRLRENGLLDLGKRRFLKTHEAAHFRSGRWLSADLRNVSSAFVFLAAGWLLSVVVLCLEVLRKRREGRKSRGVASR